MSHLQELEELGAATASAEQREGAAVAAEQEAQQV